MNKIAMNRRTFLKLAGVTTACIVAGVGGVTVSNLLKQDPFESTKTGVAQVLIQRYGETQGKALWQKVQTELEQTLAQLPNIGSSAGNMWAANMPPAALALAVYRVLVPGNATVEGVGQMLYETIQNGLSGVPSLIMRATYNEPAIMEKLKALATRSQRRQYPEDWVLTYVEGDGHEFTYGLDVTECAILKYLRAQGAPELTRYLCLTDYLTSDAIGRGLVRYQTLAEGCSTCDFRFKQGRSSYLYPLRDGWPPKFAGA